MGKSRPAESSTFSPTLRVRRDAIAESAGEIEDRAPTAVWGLGRRLTFRNSALSLDCCLSAEQVCPAGGLSHQRDHASQKSLLTL